MKKNIVEIIFKKAILFMGFLSFTFGLIILIKFDSPISLVFISIASILFIIESM